VSALLETLTTGLIRARVTNTTDTSFPTRIPTATEPSGLGDAAAQTTSAVFDLSRGQGASGGNTQYNRALIVPFGAGSDTQTFDMRILGWYSIKSRTGGDNPNTRLWVPIPLAQITCSLSLQVGVAGKVNVATDVFCDTLAIGTTTANQGVSIDVVSGANDLTAHLVVDLKGAQKLELTFDMTGATSGNALVGFY
jgi:hypothetical protein